MPVGTGSAAFASKTGAHAVSPPWPRTQSGLASATDVPRRKTRLVTTARARSNQPPQIETRAREFVEPELTYFRPGTMVPANSSDRHTVSCLTSNARSPS